MEGLQLLIEQQHEFEAYNSEKARQLDEHVNHLKDLITKEFLSICEDFEHEIKENNILSFKYKELSIYIQIINPITEKRKEKEYNFAERVTKRLKINVSIQRKKNADLECFEVLDITQYKKNGSYTYKHSDSSTNDFLELVDLFFNHVITNKVEFKQSNLQDDFASIF
ncbi:hypothetical protein F975_02071 [Acinetobacter sp. ANC 3789]|uniref:hypothetical protein n=1 Tax=Acinetobacter sp. ANC 3789 TaxID=1217714 RepID=UPI0002CDEF55|nr:hypothetical protein [Acinetobacter sp. ANC 3789]ENU80315.1 hypothetical protein F975_02071 [Acinetobacter sp. ANC 3789]